MSQKGDKNMWDRPKIKWGPIGLTKRLRFLLIKTSVGIGHGEKLPNPTPRISDQISQISDQISTRDRGDAEPDSGTCTPCRCSNFSSCQHGFYAEVLSRWTMVNPCDSGTLPSKWNAFLMILRMFFSVYSARWPLLVICWFITIKHRHQTS